MTQPLTLKLIVKDMLVNAGLKDVYDFAPSAKDCACPIVVCNEAYEQTDVLEDCEYETVTLDVIAVRETEDEALSAIGKVIFALHRADWERYGSDLKIRALSVKGLPSKTDITVNGHHRAQADIAAEICTAW